MGKIFYLMGKSASGKDSLYKEIKKRCPELKTVVLYTTRPIRDGETEGLDYFFVTEERFRQLEKQGKVIESRCYETVYGPWIYATVDDGQMDAENENFLMIGTLESYEKLLDYFGSDALVPLYVEVEDGERLTRALNREKSQKAPKYAEMCRRFLADEKDFSEEKLKNAGITRRFQNNNMEECIEEMIKEIGDA